MHNLLDDYAHDNALRDVSARLKLLLGLASMLICVSAPTPAAALFVAATLSLAVVLLARIPGRVYFHLLLVAFMHGDGRTLFSLPIFGLDLAVREEGANLALLLLARTFGGMCSLYFIALTTPMIEIFATLRYLHLPTSFIELSMMIYRYIFVFLDQAARIHSAQVMRLGDSGARRSLDSFAMLSSVLFLRSWEQGERLIIAMDSRCYDGKLDIMEQAVKATGRQMLAVGAHLALASSIAVLCREPSLL
jgi:cobalt/nickel transport system permease protein